MLGLEFPKDRTSIQLDIVGLLAVVGMYALVLASGRVLTCQLKANPPWLDTSNLRRTPWLAFFPV
jgi:hypothetical protein